MALFRTDSVVACYAEVLAAKAWWIAAFDCKSVKIPPNWDDQLPSDVALKLPGALDATILLSDEAEVKKAGLDRSDQRPLIFTSHIKKAYEHLLARGAAPTQIESKRDHRVLYCSGFGKPRH